jgi:hypothetical protein
VTWLTSIIDGLGFLVALVLFVVVPTWLIGRAMARFDTLNDELGELFGEGEER